MKILYYHSKKIFLFLIVTLSYFTSSASVVGSHIGFKAIDSTKYEVIVTYYRDCAGSPAPSTMQISVVGKSSGFFTANLSRVSIKDITGIDSRCPQKSRCSGSYIYGFEEHVYKDTIDISGGACTYRFTLSRCCRSSSITTGPANTNHYNEASINKCYGINTSVQADITPDVLVAVGQNYNGQIFIGDTADNDDSVVYRLVEPLSGSGMPVTYTGGFTVFRPVTFLGFPNTLLSYPAGFHFDRHTSELAFRPTVQNQRYVLVVEATEYRKINGVMERAAVTRMEISPTVIPMPNNKAPRVIGSGAIVCTGELLTMTIGTDDFDKGDTTTLSLKGVPQGASVTYTNVDGHEQATLTWTPQNNQVKNTPYIITATARDNACPLTSRAVKPISILVREAPKAGTIKVLSKTVQCSSAEIIIGIDSSIKKPIINIADEDDISVSSNDTARLFFKGSGWKKFTLKVSSSNFCDLSITDSVLINPQYTLQLNTKSDSSICPNSSVNFFSNSLNGNAPYQTTWFSKIPQTVRSNSSPFSEAINIPTKYTVRVVDDNFCLGLDSTSIDVYDPPVIKADTNKIEACPNAPFQLSASYVSGSMPVKYEWLGIDTLQTVTTQSAVSKRYYVEATSQEGCKTLDSTQLKLFPIAVDAGSYSTVCRNSTVQLSANAIAGSFPRVFTWLHNKTQNETTTVSVVGDSSFVIRLEDGRGCIIYDTAEINTFTPISYQLPTNTTICSGLPLNLQLNNITGDAPFTFIWDGAVSTDSSRIFTLTQTQNIPFTIIDDNNCNANDAINVTVNQNPAVNLGADKTVCQNSTQRLQAFTVGGKKPLSYQWSNSLTVDSFSTVITTPREFSILVTDANGCIDRDTVTLDTFPTQKAILTPLANPFCADAPPIGLKSIPNTGVWTGAGINGKIFNPKTAGAGLHTLTFNFSSIYNCPESGQLVAVVKQIPQPDFTTDKTQGTPNTTINFTNTTQADTTYTTEWNFGDFGSTNNTTTLANPSHTYTKVGKYTVTLKVDNGICAEESITKSNIIEIDSIINNISTAQNDILKVFPIPANAILNIETGEEIIQATLLNILGEVLIQKSNATSSEQIDVRDVKSGIYFLEVKLSSGKKQKLKVLINH